MSLRSPFAPRPLVVVPLPPSRRVPILSAICLALSLVLAILHFTGAIHG